MSRVGGAWDHEGLGINLELPQLPSTAFVHADEDHSKEAGGGSQMEELRPEDLRVHPPVQRW